MIDPRYTKKLYHVFDKENQRQIRVPIFQRAYAWKKDNWESFLKDLLEEYNLFMGVLIGVREGDTSYPIFTVIDGQQRLTTISLFILALYKRIFEICNEKSDEEFIELKNDIKKRLTINKNNEKIPRLVLSEQNKNRVDYNYLINEILGLEHNNSKPTNFGNRKLSYAYNFFYDFCKREINTLEDAKDFYKKLKNLTFVELEEDNFSNAFKLFEVLNNRGFPLSAMDIVRNSLFKELHIRGEDLEKYNIRFNKIMDNLLDAVFQTRFLRQFYMAFKNDEKIKVEKVSKATASKIIKIYEELSKRDPLFLFREFEEKSQIYNEFINFNGGTNFSKFYENLMNLGIAPAYTLLLYCRSKSIFNELNYKNLLLLLRNFFIRRNILDIPPTRELDDLFMKIVEDVDKSKNSLDEQGILNLIREKLFSRSELTDDDLFKQKLAGDIYQINSDMARYLLCLVEEHLRSKDSRINLWEKNKSNKYIFTIEHILPQEGLGKNNEWIKEIGAKDEEEAREIRDKFCHKLGNLTLTTSNSNLSDLSFEKKKNRTDRKGKPVGYNNGFKINEYIMQQERWGIKQIKERTEFLINKILDIMKLE